MRRYWWLFTLFLYASQSAYADGRQLAAAESVRHSSQPRISIIIDDLGNRLKLGKRAIRMPGQLTYSILPYTPGAKRLAEFAKQHNKEIMLHLPMESDNGRPLGYGGLYQCMTRRDFRDTLLRNIKAIPYAKGVNNHMGSLLTRSKTMMSWLMADLARLEDIYFVDSVTTRDSQTLGQAQQHGVKHTRRNIFLDHSEDAASIRKQWRRLIKRARDKGSAVAIGHPRPQTIAVLEELLPTLEREGIKLVPVSELIEWQTQLANRSVPWQISSSHSPRLVKNSKP